MLAALLALVAVIYLFPGPEGRLVIATGGADGAYNELVKTFARDLARNGVRLELREDLQGSDLLKAMRDDRSGVDGGVIKGGYLGTLTGRLASANARDRHEVETDNTRSVGRLFLEPIWVFTRGTLPIESLRDLEGKRILTGVRQSGARRVVMQLLRANNVNTDNSVLIGQELTADASALVKGEADAAVLILPPESERIQKLLRVEGIRLMNFAPEAAAYTSRFPALSSVVLTRASVEFEPVIPSADITLLATSAALIVRDELSPALASLLAHAVISNPRSPFDRTGDPILFHRAGQFPSIDEPEYEVSKDIRLIYRSGELPFLLRVLAPLNARLNLPFSFTAFASAYGVQFALLLIPALTILIPLGKVLPILYHWAVRQRLLYWYRELKSLERRVDRDAGQSAIDKHIAEIDRIDLAVRRMRVPLEFFDQLYDLRGHIDLVQRRLEQRAKVPAPSS
jgi:TRAP-type uncharacterized transport system substrate-binding protein